MHRSSDELLDVDISKLNPKQKDELQLELLQAILHTLRYLEAGGRIPTPLAAAIELEVKPVTK